MTDRATVKGEWWRRRWKENEKRRSYLACLPSPFAGGAKWGGGGVSPRSRAPSLCLPSCGCLPLSLNLPLPLPGGGLKSLPLSLNLPLPSRGLPSPRGVSWPLPPSRAGPLPASRRTVSGRGSTNNLRRWKSAGELGQREYRCSLGGHQSKVLITRPLCFGALAEAGPDASSNVRSFLSPFVSQAKYHWHASKWQLRPYWWEEGVVTAVPHPL